MKTKVAKWGNSLAVRIPSDMAEQAAVTSGDAVDLEVVGGALVMTPSRRRTPTLDEMLDNLDPATLHDEVDWGPPMGNEVW